MRRSAHLWVVAALALTAPASLFSGGFWITTYSGQAPIAAKIPDAVVLVAAEGCHNPADAQVSATAEGLIARKRRSVALKLVPTSRAGTYAVKREWPAEGVWVLNVKAIYLGRSTGAMIEMGQDGKLGKVYTKRFGETVSAPEVEDALQRLAGT